MSDSLISGQPLNLVYSYSNLGVPGASERFAVLLPTQATGSVRLQVTGSPATTRASDFLLEQPNRLKGSAIAASPRRASLRDRESDCNERMCEGPLAPRQKTARYGP